MEGITLESVEKAFSEWRAQRSSRSESIPKNLWSMALELFPQYKRSIICHKLRLSGSQFKQRLEGRHTFVDNGFVYASRDVLKENPAASNHEVKLTIQGKERTLTLCVEVHALNQILPHISVLL